MWKHRLHIGFTICIIVFCNVLVFSQQITQTIRGVVIDKFSKAPLIGANVILLNSEPLVGTTVDVDGNFRLEKVTVGRVGLKITYIGYEDIILNSLTLTSGKELVVSIEMDEKVIKSSEVVITAKIDKTRSQNRMTTVSSRSFTVEESERYAGSRYDIARMVANYAGVNGKSDARNDIIVRGNTPSGLLWRLDGVDIPNPNHFAAFGTTGGPISMIKNSLLRNSDFLTAAFPAEYGNAIAGVFDLKMLSGNNQKHEFTAQLAFNGVEVGAEGPISKKNASSYLINYRLSFLGLFKELGITFGTGDAVPQYQDLAFKINFPKTKIGSISFFGLGGKSHIAFMNSQRDTTKNNYDFYTSTTRDIINWSEIAILGINHTKLINSSSYFSNVLAVTYHNFKTALDSIIPNTLNTIDFEYSNFTEIKAFASITYNKKINSRHNFKAGIIYTGYYYMLIDSMLKSDTNAYKYKLNYKGYSNLIQPFIQWQYKLSDNFVINPGLHIMYYDHNSDIAIEPRFGIRWQFLSVHSVGFGYGLHSYKVPVSSFFNQTQLQDGTYIKVNEKLPFIKSHHFVLSYDWLISDVMRLKAEAYYQILANVPIDASHKNSFSILNLGVDFDETQPDSLKAVGSGHNKGIDITLERFLKKGFYFLITASLYDSKYKGSDNIEHNTAFNGNYTINILAGKEFIIGAKKKNARRQKTLYVDIKTMVSGNQRYTPINKEASVLQQKVVYYDDKAYSEQYPIYLRTDLKIAYKMNTRKRFALEWALEISNIFNYNNVFKENFNVKTATSTYTYQFGRMFIPSWKMTF